MRGLEVTTARLPNDAEASPLPATRDAQVDTGTNRVTREAQDCDHGSSLAPAVPDYPPCDGNAKRIMQWRLNSLNKNREDSAK